MKKAAQELLKKIDPDVLPRHIAVIMDGNRRWAKKRGLPAALGHKAGEKAFRSIVETCSDLGIAYLTAYAFSRENWKRSREEVGILMNLFEFYIREEKKYLLANNIRLNILGDCSELPPSLQKEFAAAERETADQTGLTLNLAVNYGSRSEIAAAARRIGRHMAEGALAEEQVDETLFETYLLTAGQPDPDLLIRTSGEQRLSNYLLWQCAYSELWFTDVYWPDFTPGHLLEALSDYQKRSRRFGGS